MFYEVTHIKGPYDKDNISLHVLKCNISVYNFLKNWKKIPLSVFEISRSVSSSSEMERAGETKGRVDSGNQF